MNNTEREFAATRRSRASSPPVFQALIFIAAAAVMAFSTMVIAATAI